MDNQGTVVWWKSKTLYFNLITIGLGIIEVVSKTYPIDPSVLAVIVGIGNMVLRVITGDPISFGNKTLYKGKVSDVEQIGAVRSQPPHNQ